MTTLQLYKFINDNNIEWHKRDNNGNPDVIIFTYIHDFEEFSDMVTKYSFDDGFEVVLKGCYVAIWMKDVCEFYDIDINEVFNEK